MKTDWLRVTYPLYRDDEYACALRGTGTLPEMFFQSPRAFFFAYEHNKFIGPVQQHQAWEVWRRAKGIRLPAKHAGSWIEYCFGPSGKFVGLTVTDPKPYRLHTPHVHPFLDLSHPRTLDGYDKAGECALLRDLKRLFIGQYPYSIRDGRAEAFFDDDSRFVFVGAPPATSTD